MQENRLNSLYVCVYIYIYIYAYTHICVCVCIPEFLQLFCIGSQNRNALCAHFRPLQVTHKPGDHFNLRDI